MNTARSIEELASHYRRLCKLYHPDLQAPDERAQYERHMQAINEAYSKALERFNILTYRNPKQSANKQASIHQDLFSSPPKAQQPHARRSEDAQKTERTSKQTQNAKAYATGEAARALGRALAVLRDASTFNSFKAAATEHERKVFHKALPMLHDVARRFSSLREGRDALFYAAICECNLRSFSFALHAFQQYRTRYPGDHRTALMHFYCGVCHHRLGRMPEAIHEYETFLGSKPTGIFKHFLTIVAGYHNAAQRGETPESLPYA